MKSHCPPPNDNVRDVSLMNHHNRVVSFIDESTGYDLVTDTQFRPRTAADEKPLFYYTPREYFYFWQVEIKARRKRHLDEKIIIFTHL